MNNGWIKIHRSLTTWQWYQDANTMRVFLHILLKANHKAKKWQGNDVDRGQLITSYGHLAEELNLSVQNVRTAISKLKSTGELTIKSTSRFTLITLCNYDTYQGEDLPTNKPANKQSNKRLTNDQQTTNNNQECKNEKNEKKKGKEVLVEEKELTKEEIRQAREINKQWAIEVGLIKG